MNDKTVAQELARLMEETPYIGFKLRPVMILYLIGQLQLALRHPDNTGPSAEQTADFVRFLQEKLGSRSEVLNRLCEMGWDPQFDVEVFDVEVFDAEVFDV